MPKKITSRNLLGDISKASAVDIIATVRAVATDLTSQLDKSSATYDVDRYVLSFLEQGIVLDDAVILMLKNFYDTARSTDLVTNKHVTKVLGETFILNETLLFNIGRLVTDTTLIPDTLRFDIQKSLADAPAANDALVKFLDKARSDIAQIADTKVVDFTKPRTETSSIADTSVRNPNKQPSDTARATEDPNFTVGKAAEDTARGTDTVSKGPNKQPSDTSRGTDDDTAQFNKLAEFAIVRGTDTVAKTPTKSLTETASGADNSTRQVGKNPSDTVGIPEDPNFDVSKALTDTARGTDTIGKDVTRGTTADTAAASDTDVLTVGKNLDDTSSITDSAVRTIIKAVSDFISLSEGLGVFGAVDISFANAEANISNIVDQFSRVVTYNRTFTDTARGTDAISLGPNKQPSDTARGTDADPDFTIGKNTTDTARGTDAISLGPNKQPSDTARGTDTSTRQVGKNTTDTSSVNEDPNFTVGKAAADTARGSDTDVVDFEKFLGNLLIRTYPEQTLPDYTNITNDVSEPLTITSFNRNVIRQLNSGGPLDLTGWINNLGVGTSNILSYGQDNTYSPSPVGGIPLRITSAPVAGLSYFVTFNNINSNLYPVISLNETWTASIYARSSAGVNGDLVIYGAAANGAITETSSITFTYSTSAWQRHSITYTFTNPATKFIQILFTTGNTGGSPQNYYYDGLQVEKSPVATTFSDPNTTRATDLISQKQVGKATTDTARGTDTITQKQVAKTGITDTARGTDADPDFTIGKNPSDTARGTDAFSRVVTFNRTAVDTARGTDAISLGPNKQPSDTARGTDSFSRVVQYSKNYTDTARGTDSFSRVVQYSKDYTDTARGTDALANRLNFYAGGDQSYVETDFTGRDYLQDIGLLPSYRSNALFDQYNIDFTAFSNGILSAAVSNPANVALFITTQINGRSLGDIDNNGTVNVADALQALRFTLLTKEPVPSVVTSLPNAQQYDWVMNYVLPYMVANSGAYAAFLTRNGSEYSPARKADKTNITDISVRNPNKQPSDTASGTDSASRTVAFRRYAGERNALLYGTVAPNVTDTSGGSIVRYIGEIHKTYSNNDVYHSVGFDGFFGVVNAISRTNVGSLATASGGSPEFYSASIGNEGFIYSGGLNTGLYRNSTQIWNSASFPSYITKVVFGIDRAFVLVDSSTNYYSAIVGSLSSIPSPTGSVPSDLYFENGLFIMMTGTAVYTSTTGIIGNWTARTTLPAVHGFSASVSFRTRGGIWWNPSINAYTISGTVNNLSGTKNTLLSTTDFVTYTTYNLPAALVSANVTYDVSVNPVTGSILIHETSNFTEATLGRQYYCYRSENGGTTWTADRFSFFDSNPTYNPLNIRQAQTAVFMRTIAPGLTQRVLRFNDKQKTDTVSQVDTVARTFSPTVGGESTYTDLDVAGVGDIPSEIAQYYTRRNYQPRSFEPQKFFNFNSAVSGPNGPANTSQIVATSNESFSPSVTNGYISYFISTTGTYTFDIVGASGGVFTADPPTTAAAPVIDGYKRAPGARVTGSVNLTQGQIVTMVIGQGGGDDPQYNNPGGGGGTFVTLGTYADVVNASDVLLFAAGGGGGGGTNGGASDNYSAGIGQAGTSGGTTVDGVGGIGGVGAGFNATTNSTGGGGYGTNAGGTNTPNFGGSALDGSSGGFRQGSVGSRNAGVAVGYGGFGGGGSGSSQVGLVDNDKGGGGGYSGGAFAFDANVYGGGGGSFASPLAFGVTITAGGGTTRNGSVLITRDVLNQPTFGTYIRSDRVGMGDVKAITLVKAASGEARTKQTEFTPINYTQDLLDIFQPDI